MAATLRALRALLLLAGFYVMGTLLLALILGTDAFIVYELFHGQFRLGLIYLLAGSLVLAAPIIDGMFILGRRGPNDGPDGYLAAEPEQPELWAQIRESARLAGTRAPDRVILVGEVNAAVAEHTRMLGLFAGRRTLYLGVPLLAGLTVPRLRGVLAHEFGHYGHQDTRLSAITMRGRVAILNTVEAFRAGAADGGRGFALIGNLYVRYARLYLRGSQSVARRQELAADRAAALAVGREATANALREVPVLHASFSFYLERYATLGVPSGLLPPAGEFYGGFRHLLAEPRRVAELAALRAELPEEERSPYDSHPPMAERVRLIEALPPDDRTDDPSAPVASTLLRDPVAVLAEVEKATLSEELAGMRRLGWDDLVHSAGWSAAAKAAEPLRTAVFAVRPGANGNLPTTDETLDAVDAGLLWTAVADRFPGAAPAARTAGRPAHDLLAPAVREGMAALVHLSLAHSGRARWELSWSGTPVRLVLPAAWPAGALDAALDAAVGGIPDTAPLRALLAAAPDAAPPTAEPPAAEPAPAAG